jgi:hypothetical protein
VRHRIFGIGWPFGSEYSSCSTRKPRLFDWTDNPGAATVPTAVCMDTGIADGLNLPGRKIAWLLESPAINQFTGASTFVMQNLEQVLDAYEVVLTSDRNLCLLDPKITYHPAGSNLPWIPEPLYGLHTKNKLCSMFASSKQMVEGHRVRHRYAERFRDRLDLFGGALGSPRLGGDSVHPDKSQGIIPYMFNIAMENCQVSTYYSEKLTDCFATGTVPVYWGADDVPRLFDESGVLRLDDDFDIASLTPALYHEMRPALEHNLELVRQLEGSDDLLYRRYLQG